MQIFRVDNIVFAKKVFLSCFAKCNQDYLELKFGFISKKYLWNQVGVVKYFLRYSSRRKKDVPVFEILFENKNNRLPSLYLHYVC